MFTLKNIKSYSTGELYRFKGTAILSQGNGSEFSKMIENRIIKIESELNKRFLKTIQII